MDKCSICGKPLGNKVYLLSDGRVICLDCRINKCATDVAYEVEELKDD